MVGNKLREASQAGPTKTLGEVVFVFQQLLSNYDTKLALDLANFIIARTSLANCELSLTSDEFAQELQPFISERTSTSGTECAGVLDVSKPRQSTFHEPRIPAKWGKRWQRAVDGDCDSPSLSSQLNSLDSYSSEEAFSQEADIFRTRFASLDRLPEYDYPTKSTSLDSVSSFKCSSYSGGPVSRRSKNSENSTSMSSSERRTIRGHCSRGGPFDREESCDFDLLAKPRSLDGLPQATHEDTRNNPAQAASLDSLPQFSYSARLAREVTRPNTNRDNAAPIRDSYRRAFRRRSSRDQSNSDTSDLEETKEHQDIGLGKSDSLLSIGRPCVHVPLDDPASIDDMIDRLAPAKSFHNNESI